MVSYLLSVATIALSCIISEIKQYIDQKSSFFHTPLHLTPVMGGGYPFGMEKLEWSGYLTAGLFDMALKNLGFF